MKLIKAVLLLGIALLGASFAYAQENESKPIDEVIARVNAGVIMRSAFEAAQRDILEMLKGKGLKGEEQVITEGKELVRPGQKVRTEARK